MVFEGILALHDPALVELMDLRVFVDTDDDIRLARRRTCGARRSQDRARVFRLRPPSSSKRLPRAALLSAGPDPRTPK